MTQLEVIRQKLLRDGEVDTVWAVKNYILRLSARIMDLKRKPYSMDIEKEIVAGTHYARYSVKGVGRICLGEGLVE